MGEPPTSGPSAAAAFMGLPLNVDLALHAAPAVALLLDFFFFERKYTKHQVTRVAPLAVVFFGLWYVSFAEYCASYNGRCRWCISLIWLILTNYYRCSSIPVLGIPIFHPRLGLHWGDAHGDLFLPSDQLSSFLSCMACSDARTGWKVLRINEDTFD